MARRLLREVSGLRQAELTTNLCTKECEQVDPHPASRLIPLPKPPDETREWLRRTVVNQDITRTAGNLRICSDQPGEFKQLFMQSVMQASQGHPRLS